MPIRSSSGGFPSPRYEIPKSAEVPTSATGHFRFFAAPGEWTLRALAPKSEPTDKQVIAQQGVVAEVALAI